MTFKGDPTGRTDVTSSLRDFLESHDGQRVAFVKGGRYKVTQMSFTAHHLTIDFNGARIQGSLPGAHGIFRLQTSKDVVVNDAIVFGTGYGWNFDTQFEHAIQIDGGADIILNDPFTRRTRGDGIYVGFQIDKNKPPTGVVINRPNVERASRNGISPVAGEVTIRGGHVAEVGLHGIDFEPASMQAGASIRGVVQGVDIRRHSQLDIGPTGYAVAAGGTVRRVPRQPIKISMVVEDVTGDCLRMTIRNTAMVIVRDNISDVATGASFPGSRLISFTGNVRIKGTLNPVETCNYSEDGIATASEGAEDAVADWTLLVHEVLYWLYVSVPEQFDSADRRSRIRTVAG